MKLVQACLNARGDQESIFCRLWRSWEACAGLFKCQERWRKQFSPLCRSCEARASLFFLSRKDRGSNFHHRGDALKHVQAF